MKLLGAELHDSLALWPNPRLAGTPGEIAPVLARPTLLAIVRLVRRHGAAQVAAVNAALVAAGEIGSELAADNAAMIEHVAAGGSAA